MSDREIPRPRRTKAGITYSNLGQFRVHVVNDDPPPPLVLDAPDSVADAWRTLVVPNPWFDPEKEHMIVFVLNTRLGLKGWNVVSVGTINETTCHPREVLRPVLVAAGHALIMAHNYHSVPRNQPALRGFTRAALRLWWRSLRRRSHKSRYDWQRFYHRLARRWMPVLRVLHPYPEQRLCVTT